MAIGAARVIGYELTLQGFGGANIRVLEVVGRDDSGTYRTVYTVQFEKAVYVLHTFQKKSRGTATQEK